MAYPGDAPSLKLLWAEISAAYGGAVSFEGIRGDASHAARKSAHNVGLALDVGVGNNHDLGWQIANHFLADGRAYNAIHNRRGRRADWRGGSTFSASGHESHVHLEIHEGARQQTHTWGFSNIEEVDMTPEQDIKHTETWNRARNLEGWAGNMQTRIMETWQRAKNIEGWAGDVERQLDVIEAKLADLSVTGGSVDMDALADRIADKLAARLKD